METLGKCWGLGVAAKMSVEDFLLLYQDVDSPGGGLPCFLSLLVMGNALFFVFVFSLV